MLAANWLQAQQFTRLTDGKPAEVIENAELLPNETIVALQYNRAFAIPQYDNVFLVFENLVTELNNIDSTFSEIQVFDLNMNIVNSLPIESDEDTLLIYQDFYVDEEAEQIIFAGTQLTETDSIKLFLITDFELNVINKVYLENSHLGDNFIIQVFTNDVGNIVVRTFYSIAEYDRDGNLINSDFNLLSIKWSLIYHNNQYLEFRGEDITYYNDNFDFLGIIPPQNVPTLRRSVAHPIKPKNKDYFYVAGLNGTDLISANEALIKVYGKFNKEVIYLDTITPYYWMSAGLKSLDLFSESHIYFGSKDQSCGFMQQSVFDPDSNDPCNSEYVTLNCVDSLGTVNWSKYLGGDGTYFALDIVATPDSGCIYFVAHHNYEINLFNEYDTYYIKFDKNGNVVNPEPTVGLNENNTSIPINIYDVLVYPNPSSHSLHFKSAKPFENMHISIYKPNGQLVHQSNILNQAINIEALSADIYTYTLSSNDAFIQNGQFVKQ